MQPETPMIEAPPYPREAERLAALRALNLLDTPIQQRFERITRMVCCLLEVPIAHFNLLDADRQHFKSVQGLDAIDVPMEGAFCTHSIHEEKMLVLPDASKDPRFADNPFVTGRFLSIRFYAGCPVRAPNGLPVGTLCAIDTRPRRMRPEQLKLMLDLVAMLETELQLSSLSNAHNELIAQLSAAERLARIDTLTRLWNRAGILELLQKEWTQAERHRKPVTVVMADLDHFKAINDTYGHQAGDAVIAGAAKQLLETTRNEDAVGRLGGEEFLVILTACTPESVRDTVERMRLGINEHAFMAGETRMPVTVSCGAATTVPQAGSDWNELLKRADDALYRAKSGGRNRTEIDWAGLGAASLRREISPRQLAGARGRSGSAAGPRSG
jgi:diguanylate cyclase (GGDEF)-like protein